MLTEILSKPYISQLKGDSSDKIGGDGNFLLFSFFFPFPCLCDGPEPLKCKTPVRPSCQPPA